MPKIKAYLSAGLLCILLLVLSACGGGDGAPAESFEEVMEAEPAADAAAEPAGAAMITTLPDACSLLTNAEIAAATGGLEPLSANGGVDEDGLFSSCTWLFSESGVGSLSLNIWSSGGAGMGWAAQFLEIQMGGFAEGNEEPMTIDGLGDQAFLAVDNDFYGLWWRQGNDIVAGLTAAALPVNEGTMIQLGQTANDFR